MLLTFWLSSHAVVGNYVINSADTNDTIPYTIDVSPLGADHDITITFTLNHIKIISNNSQPGKELVLIDGFGQSMLPGTPATPAKNLLLAIQTDTNCDIEIVSSSYQEMSCDISSAVGPSFANGLNNSVTPISPYSGYNKDCPLSYIDVQTYRGQHIHRLCVNPVFYNYNEHKIKICTSFTAKLKTQLSTTLKYATSTFDRYTATELENITDYVIDGKRIITFNDSSIPIDEDLAIITTDAALPAMTDFIEWKETLGYNVHVYSRLQWTPDQIKTKCAECYNNLENLTNMILIGDVTDIPGIKHDSYCHGISYEGQDSVYYSDFHYSCMDGDDDYIPEFFIARIPFSDVNRLTTYFNKVIKYEQKKLDNTSLYKQHAVCSYFEYKKPYFELDETDYESEYLRFVRTSEDIASYGESLGYNIYRLYAKDSLANPKYWSYDNLFANHEPIPDYLRLPNFQWNATKNDIINTFNSGISTFMYSYHGGEMSWCQGDFTNADTKLFKNKNVHPIVFSMACLTGSFKVPKNLATSLIEGENGAIGAFAASDVSFTPHNDALISGIYDALWPSPGFKPIIGSAKKSTTIYTNPQRRPCDLISYGFNYLYHVFPNSGNDEGEPDWSYNQNKIYNDYEREVFHYFGDPTMIFHSDAPEESPWCHISKTDNGCEASFSGSPQIISFKGFPSGKIQRFYGTKATFVSPSDSLYQVCVSGKDIVPDVRSIYNKTLTLLKSPCISSCKYNSATRTAELTLKLGVEDSDIKLVVMESTSTLPSEKPTSWVNRANKTAGVDFSNCSNGIYIITLIVDGKICDNKQILVN